MLPSKFSWLLEIGPLPKVIESAIGLLGVQEIKGPKNNPVIMGMAKSIGVQDIYTSDDLLSWCALFVNYVLWLNGKPMIDPKGDKWNLLRARYLSSWGRPVTLDNMKLGDLVVFAREGGGHVAFYIAETKHSVFVIGGNQSNAVTITEIAKSRIIGVRNYYATTPPASVKKYFVDSSGKLSNNEA